MNTLELQLDKAWPTTSWRDSHVVLAVSGGADSVAMLRAGLRLKESGGGSGQLFAAHLNHRLRPDADVDAQWLSVLCQQLQVPLHIGSVDVKAKAAQMGDGLEAAAREDRYDFLRRTAEQLGARFVATAHTATDQAETVLHHVIRGTGLKGLGGISMMRPLSGSVTLVRPLLQATRRDVLDYLAAIDQDFREDATNTDRRLTRNRLRHELLPQIRDSFNADVDSALVRLAAQARDAQQLISAMAAALADKCVSLATKSTGEKEGAAPARPSTSSIRIACQHLQNERPLIVREVCRTAWSRAGWPEQAVGFAEWQQLAHLVQSSSDAPTINLPGGIRACRRGGVLFLDAIA
jgi:tRNA(Ile)-lysidine synthase